MEPPLSLGADDLQSARESVVAAFRPLEPEDVVLGQFDGYLDTEGVAEGSTTDTFAAVRLWVDTDRWHGVPFLLRSGKQARAERPAGQPGVPRAGRRPPALGAAGRQRAALDLSGDGAIGLGMVVKEPGAGTDLATSTVSLKLGAVEGAEPLPPYVRLIHDVVVGDRSLFTRPDGLEHAWDVVTPVLDARPEALPYEPGSHGPDAAADLAAPDGWLLDRD
ncbi:hypothetical protein GCM10025868_25840 [Angustibacter aerolatus]|uniref:Glucose-6-phosphate dehydrogenase C-terminal domain-containing protein n=1 Tax=Angustibacter aerolatus TaxID=1162965 RepID=A0ABQ6JJN6_9ACTN|nr:hypothetical protein [Angustibacter aerolatus]GMA87334.1 hypothetical protein GCM10025868_25840 [Angustibacter aerolatus]